MFVIYSGHNLKFNIPMKEFTFSGVFTLQKMNTFI